jgi:hypothetical protein
VVLASPIYGFSMSHESPKSWVYTFADTNAVPLKTMPVLDSTSVSAPVPFSEPSKFNIF